MGDALRCLVCGTIGGLAALFLVGNWLIMIGTAKTQKPTSLVFPFLCGPVCAAACWFSPSTFLQQWFWVPFVLDYTMLILLSIGVAAVARRFRRLPPVDGGPDATHGTEEGLTI